MSHAVQLNNAPEFLGRLIRTAKPFMLPREFIRNAIDNPVPGVPLALVWLIGKSEEGTPKLVLPMYDDVAFEAWWRHKGELAARLTYGRHYVSAYIYAKQGREDEAKAMLSQPATFAAVAHHLDFNKRMLRYVEAEKKVATVVAA